ncbi:PTS cellobiose transporter subunit IIC [Heyndrickxia oleronia]|uniref:PTS cellobiose transporter subunit IIC n=1 Tax=Heyndrickxia oleronia TaxID=38875 RepID=UPI001C0EE9C9|nr:PTS cellobiose transporter subunit IIC [Heyndrickxia oleronia]MBU5210828.1 PTS cellobiose transporter subunit IIC [Heyndrickxia oleronia]
MNKLMNFLERYITPFAAKVGNQRHLISIRDGIIMAMPLIIVGSLFLIIANLPIHGYNEFMAHLFGSSWQEKLTYPVGATFDILGLVISFGIAYRLAERYKVEPVSAGIISLAAFVLTTPHQTLFTKSTGKTEIISGVLPINLLGSQGIFIAMIFALLSTEIYRIIIQKNITIKMPSSVPPAVAKSFSALVPAFTVIVLVWIIRLIVGMTPWEDIPNMISTWIGMPLKHLGGSLGGTLVIVFCISLLWMIGLHGDNIVGAVMSSIWLALMDENRMAFQDGMPLPHVITQQFFDNFLNLGGTGATLAIVLLMLIVAKSKQMKQLGKLSIGASVFNISEPTVFGTPIVLNPFFMIPFILTPLVLTIINYVTMSLGLVAAPSGVAVPWTMPIVLSGFLATGHLSGAIIQIIDLLVAMFIYYPFFRMWDKQRLREETKAEQKDKVSALS